MNKIYISCIFYFFLYNINCYSQDRLKNDGPNKPPGSKEVTRKKYDVKWKSYPFDHRLFIENKGQFDGIIPNSEKVLFAAQIGKVMAYFTAHGVTYQLKEYPNHGVTRNDPDKNPDCKPIYHSCSATWERSNAGVSILPEDKQPSYYTYPKGLNGTIIANIFRKIKYKNLYPGIDAEYFFPQGKKGIEYTLTIHPGANLSAIKLFYGGIKKINRNENGDVVIESNIDEITDHAPIAAFEDDFASSVPVSFQIDGNVETFKFSEPVDKSKTIIIDPWTTNPNFTAYDNAYDLDFDNAGNVYVYGGIYTSSYQCEKFNSSGVIQWTFNASVFTYQYYGDLVVDHHSQNTYLVEGFNTSGAEVLKINPNGILAGTFPGNPNLQEMWRAVYDACNGRIVIGAGGTDAENQACMLDTNMVSITPVNILGATNPYHDIGFICIDPSGYYSYMATPKTTIDNFFNNVVCKLPLPNLSPTVYITPEHFDMLEDNSITYVSDILGGAAGMNGMAASPNWLYMYDGKTLKQLFKNTGLQNDSTIISTTSFQWGGLTVDACDDIFLGCQDTLKVYNSSLVLDTAIRMPNTIYDVVLGQGNLLYLCGDSFVSAITVPVFARLISTATGIPTSCSACNGSASVSINCGVSPYSFLWSNGETTQTDTGLCAGIYTVTVTDASCPPRIDTAIVNVPGEAGFTASAIDSNPNCSLSLGNATVYPNGGNPPYTYSWSNGETTQKDTGLVAGNYTCTVTDNSGCRYSVIINLINPVTPTITIVPHNDSICSGTNLPMTASGVSTYTWTPTSGLSCYNCPSPTASPTATTTYTVMGADSNGCSASATTVIKVYTTPRPVITGKDSICSGNIDTLSVTGGSTYTWSTGATTSTISITVTSTQTVTVSAHNGICSHDTTITIIDVSNAARITASRDSTCAGDTVKLTGSGGLTYRWSTSSTNPVIIVNPSVPTTYTLYTAYGACSDSAIVRIGIIKQAAASLSTSPDSVCPGSSVTLTATLTSGTGTFKWSNGATSSSITVDDSVSTTYTATVYGKCDTVSYTITNKVVPLPKPVISGAAWRCRGIKDTLTVSGGTTYLWSNGSTNSTYITGSIESDSAVQVTAYNSLGCSISTTFSITLRNAPVVTISKPPLACTGLPIEIVPTVSGTGPFTYSWAPNGETTDSISVASPPDSTSVTYTAYVSNGCTTPKTVTISAEFPVLTAIGTQTVTLVNDTLSPAYATLWASGNSTVYFWQDSILVTCINPNVCDTVRVSPSVTTTYTVTGFDKAGCEVTGYVTVVVEAPCLDFKVPNVFTPNYPGPYGRDDHFFVETENISGWSITIFDRWGKTMYNSTDVHKPWDGTNENGDAAADGVYYYVITGVCQNNTYKKEGFVQLIR